MKSNQPRVFSPAASHPINDLATMKILVTPRRLQILSLLTSAERTVKEVAAVVHKPASRLYYHFNLLEDYGLIRVVATRKVAGTIEKRYRAVALNFVVDPALLSNSVYHLTPPGEPPPYPDYHTRPKPNHR